MERHFELELEKLKKRILKMGDLVADQVHNTMLALQSCDVELAAQVIRNDKIVDKLDVKIDKLCQRIFALTQPVATDLRLIMSSLKMNNDLERMGDHAVGIAYKIEAVSDYKEIMQELEIGDLIRMTDAIVTDVITILNTWNTTFVKDIFTQASAIEERCQQISDHILAEMSQKKGVIVVATTLMIILTQIERIAGYSTNIAESIVFIVDGKMIKHRKPESLFLEPDAEE
ncbi:MAG: phosphate transport system regulatory protein PhoU [Bacteroidetes bacterium]|nr:MAG: phosphate transport system regulatory protein PhoU [Bacteroidota bacterium]